MMGSVDILIGLQWGDEGKGKIVDFMTPQYDVVARFQGGPNAGHTLQFQNVKHVLHQIPSGIFHPQSLNIIGNGVVLDPITFHQEITQLKAFNLDLNASLFISNKAQLILPTHKLLDQVLEQSKGDDKIGSTLRGIGPTYEDKVGRVGLRVGDILSQTFDPKYQKLKNKHLQLLNQFELDSDIESEEKKFFEGIETIKKFNIINSEYFINEKIKEGKKILAEGAQGTLLDVDFGSYPFVTSSNTTAAAACTGLGIAPSQIKNVFGIFKAYCTRVGSGPFPTELQDEIGNKMLQKGNEVGATTGRPRRCGWLDLPLLKYASMINGVTQLFMMKTDVLEIFDEIKICDSYQTKDANISYVPYDYNEILKPNYETIPSWGKIENSKNMKDLPQNLKKYKEIITQSVGIPIQLVSYGPDRSETLFANS